MGEVPRLAILASHPVQYQAPLWRQLAGAGEVDPKVLFLSRHGLEPRSDPNFGVSFSWDVDLLSGYDSQFVHNVREQTTPGGLLSHVNPGILRALAALDPAAVLFLGVRTPTSVAALGWARRRGIGTIYRAESSAMQKRSLRALVLGAGVLRAFDAVVPIGTANDLYFQAAGIPSARRFLAPYSVDNDYFRRARVTRVAARDAVGVGEQEFIVLYAGKLVEWKDPMTIVEACARLRSDANVRLLIAGDGPLRPAVAARAAQLALPLTNLGFVNQSELSSAYSAADVLALGSRDEPWGLVVNEAMCHELPVVVSDAVGSRLDLVRPGRNGGSFPVGDVEALSALLGEIAGDVDRRLSYGAASAEIINGWGLPETASGIARAVKAVGSS